jgi:hypothetical protein
MNPTITSPASPMSSSTSAPTHSVDLNTPIVTHSFLRARPSRVRRRVPTRQLASRRLRLLPPHRQQLLRPPLHLPVRPHRVWWLSSTSRPTFPMAPRRCSRESCCGGCWRTSSSVAS